MAERAPTCVGCNITTSGTVAADRNKVLSLGLSLYLKKVGPSLHHRPTALKHCSAVIGCLYSVREAVGQCMFGNLARIVTNFG